MIRTIVFPTDFSVISRDALHYTAELARKFNARIVGVHAVRVLGSVYNYLEETGQDQEVLERQYKLRLKSFFDHPFMEGISVDFRVGVGIAEEIILETLNDVGADLLVIGKTDRSAVERFFVGSVTERVLRNAICPVLVIPEQGSRSIHWSPILCAVDAETWRGIVEYAVRFTSQYGEDLIVLHVVETNGIPQDEATGRYIRGVVEERRRLGEEFLRTSGAGRMTQLKVETGRPSEVIFETVAQHGVDLTILGVRGSHIQKGQGIGTTARRVLQNSSVPLLFIP